jgi:hypothetical protein
MSKLWSFLWRFVVIGLPLWWVTGYLIGVIVLASGSQLSLAYSIFAVVQWVVVLPVAALLAWGQLLNLEAKNALT